MALKSLLIANRGEIACRVARAAAELGIPTTAVYALDDAQSLHVRKADAAQPLSACGARAYLDMEEILAIARRCGCDSIHPGYGFLSESSAFASACENSGLIFVGPTPETLAAFGDKVRARELAARLQIPVIAGSKSAVTAQQALQFKQSLGSEARVLLKAVAGGGGRGLRIVVRDEELTESHRQAQWEARASFGNAAVYVEEYWPRARHLEVQVVGDGDGAVTHLWERECTLQRRHQKLIELAPSPGLGEELRQQLIAAALRMAQEVAYRNLGTFEFLVTDSAEGHPRFAFIEANPRLQVEHTVTEEVLGIDLLKLQLQIAAGSKLAQLGLQPGAVPPPRGMAMQLRINLETLRADGTTKPSAGILQAYEPPGGLGIRVDGYGYAGYRTVASFDSLLAKLIVTDRKGDFAALAARAYRALCEFNIAGVATNIGLLQNLLQHPQVLANRIHTRFVDEHAAELIAEAAHAKLFAASRAAPDDTPAQISAAPTHEDGSVVQAPLAGVVASIEVQEGSQLGPGQVLLIIESMKMEHVVAAPRGGTLRGLYAKVGEPVAEGALLAHIEPAEQDQTYTAATGGVDIERIRPDLQEVLERHERALDASRPEAVARRRQSKQRTARENIEALCDPGSFVEYGPLVLAAQRARRTVEELIDKSPADGMVTGVGRINGHLFDDPASSAVVMAYDYTVFAGTQGTRNHLKTDRMIHVAKAARMPVVLFAEGGGGRPGDTESSGDAGGVPTFGRFAELSAEVPLIGIVAGRCFAGNASLAGCCDVLIATADSNIGMGGPAMVEGGGLGVFKPEEIGPAAIQRRNGVIDIVVDDEIEAVNVAKRYLAFFQGTVSSYEVADQRLLRQLVPENRLRVYDVRTVIETLADCGSVLELRTDFAPGMITALLRIEGRPIGVIANNPLFLGGAIDSDGSDKAARFMQLCDAHDLPLLFLCDTPGIMVGPDAERTALVRHSSRMFLIGANLSVPTFAIVLRKAYGLGALAMAGGSFKRPAFTVAWPTGEFGGMGLEGAVKLAYRNELAAIADAAARRRKYEELVARMYEHGKALNISTIFGVDDTIDPAQSRQWLVTALRSVRLPARPATKRWPAIDAW